MICLFPTIPTSYSFNDIKISSPASFFLKITIVFTVLYLLYKKRHPEYVYDIVLEFPEKYLFSD